MANHMMARQGFAVPLVVPPNVRHVESIRAAADSARQAALGLWAVEAFACLPETFREGLCGATSVAGEQPLLFRAVSSIPAIGECDPSYPDVCIPPPPPDLDCGDISHRRFRVLGRDPHRFDGDKDGIGCEGR